MSAGPTTRGPKYVRKQLRAHVREKLAPLVPYLRAEWGDEGAFPPAGPEANAPAVPKGDEQIQTAMGRPQDRYPLVQIELSRSSVRRGEIETTSGSDSVSYLVTYDVAVFVWVDVEPPETTSVDEEREFATDVRDDVQMAMRYLLLDTQPGEGLQVLANGYVEDYGEPQAAGGQRWTVGGRARFSLRAQERLSRASLATVTSDTPEFTYGVTVHTVPVDHPALQ